jgi:FtsP/CotA-like multicopper oxidase with cupredoxin domain
MLAILGGASCHRAVAQTAAKPDFTLRIGPVTVEPVKGKVLRTIGYNGSAPGPLLRLTEGSNVTIEVFNGSDAPELVHWHGLHIPGAVDGSMEEGTPMIAPHSSARYTFIARPAGTRWYHTHTMAGRNLKRSAYTGQFGFLYVEPKSEPGAYDREVFLALKEWDPYLTTMGGDDAGLDVAYKYASINGFSLGHGEPVRVKEGERVMLRILNASATLHRRLAFAGHTLRVTALDGNQVAAPAEVSALELGPGERIDAIVEMKNPGVWIFGATESKERRAGMGIVFEYGGKSGEPQWLPATTEVWDYTRFGKAPLPDASREELPLVIKKKFAGSRWVDNWTINGKAWPKTNPIRVRANGRYRLVFDNQSDEAHPVHLHRHTFELARIGGKATAGVFKDVVVAPPMSKTEVNLDAVNPGSTLFHCHQQMHMDYGFMAMMEYS